MEAKTKYTERPWLRAYPEGVPESVDVPERSLPQVFDEVTDKYGDRTAVVFYGTSENIGNTPCETRLIHDSSCGESVKTVNNDVCACNQSCHIVLID